LRVRLKADGQVRLPALEAAMKAAAADTGLSDGMAGRPIEYDEIEPWVQGVNGPDLLTELSGAIGTYVVMDAHQRDAVALWTVFAHAHDLRDHNVAPKAVRKDQAAGDAGALGPATATHERGHGGLLARLVEKHRPALFIDEFDAIAHGDKEVAESLRGQFNSSFNKRSAVVLKLFSVPGNGWEERKFSTWAPTCVAGIGTVPDTVQDRSVIIRLNRKLRNEAVRRLRGKDGGDLSMLARKISALRKRQRTAASPGSA
jgi:putative DNA primase/helicase